MTRILISLDAFATLFAAAWIAIKYAANHPAGLSEPQRRRLVKSGIVIVAGLVLAGVGWYLTDPHERIEKTYEFAIQMAALLIVVTGMRMVTRWAVPMRAPWLSKTNERG